MTAGVEKCRATLRTVWVTVTIFFGTGVVISEVDVLTYVVHSKAEKHVRYRELVGTEECVTL